MSKMTYFKVQCAVIMKYYFSPKQIQFLHLHMLHEMNSVESCYVLSYATNVSTDTEIRREKHERDLRIYVLNLCKYTV